MSNISESHGSLHGWLIAGIILNVGLCFSIKSVQLHFPTFALSVLFCRRLNRRLTFCAFSARGLHSMLVCLSFSCDEASQASVVN